MSNNTYALSVKSGHGRGTVVRGCGGGGGFKTKWGVTEVLESPIWLVSSS